jgi:hypothetical protein
MLFARCQMIRQRVWMESWKPFSSFHALAKVFYFVLIFQTNKVFFGLSEAAV